MSNEISVTYLRDLAKSYRADSQPQIANDLVQAANTITALRTERDSEKRERKQVQSKLRACAQARQILARESIAFERELDAMRRDRDECALKRDYWRRSYDAQCDISAEYKRERDLSRSVNERLRNGRDNAAKRADNANTLLEQAEYERDRQNAIALRETERANDNARRLGYLRNTAQEQCEYAGIKEKTVKKV